MLVRFWFIVGLPVVHGWFAVCSPVIRCCSACFSCICVIDALKVCAFIVCDSHLAPDQYAACSLLVGTWFNDSASFANACFKVWFDIDSTLVHGWFSDGPRLVRG